MSCSFDRIGITIDKKENIKTFVDIYNRELEDHLYWGKNSFLSEDSFRDNDGVYRAYIEEEPLFTAMENGEQLVDVIYKYIETVPDCVFSAWYECAFSNCGAIVYTTYNYKDGLLTIVDRSSESSYPNYCPECDWEPYPDDDGCVDGVCSIYEWRPDEECKCPVCGAALDWEVCFDETTLRMIDGKLDAEENQ